MARSPRGRKRRRPIVFAVATCVVLAAATWAFTVIVLDDLSRIRPDCQEEDPPFELGPRAVCASSGAADADGDGIPDEIVLYLEREVHGSYRIVIRVEFFSGGEARVAVGRVDAGAPIFARLYGVVDLDGQPGKEILFVEDLGANSISLGLVTAVRGNLRRVPVHQDGSWTPATLVVGAAISHGSGFACTGRRGDQRPRLEQRWFSASFDDPHSWTWNKTVFRWEGKKLLFFEEDAGVVRTEDWGSDPRPARYIGGDCDLQLV